MNDSLFEDNVPVKKKRKKSGCTPKAPTSCNDSGFPVSGHPVPPELMTIIDFLAEKTAREHILGTTKKNE